MSRYAIVSWPSAKVVGNAMSQTWSDRHRILLVTRARQRLKNWGVSAGALMQMEGTEGHGGSSRNSGTGSVILEIFQHFAMFTRPIPTDHGSGAKWGI